jgi:hypothetical protein
MKSMNFVGRCLLVFAALIVSAFVVVNVFVAKCDPREGQSLLFLARTKADGHLREIGRLGDIETILRAEHQRSVDVLLEKYRLVTIHSKNGYEIRVEPRYWGFCRPTQHMRIAGSPSG